MMKRRKSFFCSALMLTLLASATSFAQKPNLVVQTGHTDRIDGLIFSPDGRIIASSSADRTIRLWDALTGRELRRINGQGKFSLFGVNALTFSPDNETLVSIGYSSINLWNVNTGKQVRSLPDSAAVSLIQFSPDGKVITGVSTGGLIKQWDSSTGVKLREVKLETGAVVSSLSPDSKILVSLVTEQDKVTIWDVPTGKELPTLQTNEKIYWPIVFNFNGQTIATIDSGRMLIKLWDVLTGREIRTLRLPKPEVIDLLSFSPNNELLVSASRGGRIRLWDVASGRQLFTLSTGIGDSEELGRLTFSPDGKTLAVGLPNGTIRILNTTAGEEVRTLSAHSVRIDRIRFSLDGKTFTGFDYKDNANIWNLATGVMSRTVNLGEGKFSSRELSSNNNVLAKITEKKSIKLFDVGTGRELCNLAGQQSEINIVSISPHEDMLASGSTDGHIKLWDILTCREIRTIEVGPKILHYTGSGREVLGVPEVHHLAFSPDSNFLASASGVGKIDLWKLSTGEKLYSLDLQGDLHRLSFSPNGKILISEETWDNIVRLWDVSTGKLWAALRSHSDVAFSPDGKLLASGEGETLKLWDTTTQKELQSLAGHTAQIRSLAFSVDGRLLASCADEVTKIWDVASGRELVTLVSIDEHDWLVTTPDGLFDGSPAAWDLVLWRFGESTFDVLPVEAFFNEFYYPNLLANIFSGKRPEAAQNISKKDRRQPKLELSLFEGQHPAEGIITRNIKVKIGVSEIPADKDHETGSGVKEVKLFRNGSLVKAWHGDVLNGHSSTTLEVTIPIVAGVNRITAYAFNHDNIKSADTILMFRGADNLKRKGTAYILAIGVNEYANSQYNLKYAVADARTFTEEVKRQQEKLEQYQQIEIIPLHDKEATKPNILRALGGLHRKVQPEDAVIFYFAGHGTAQQNRFYLIPHDLGYAGPRDAVNETGLKAILAHSISDRELEQAFEQIDAGQILFVIDACNSGQALEAEEKRRGPMNSKGLAQLAYEKGMYILTAAQSYQAALEASQVGHGLLTYALVEEGLKQGMADDEPKDGQVVVREWLDYATNRVPVMQINKMKAARGLGLNLSFKEDERGLDVERRSGQQPRVFYRRELEAQLLIVAKTIAAPPKQ